MKLGLDIGLHNLLFGDGDGGGGGFDTTGLVARWGFNGNVEDSSPNELDGTEINGPLSYVAGVYGQAVDLDSAASQEINFGPSTDLDLTDEFTFCGWVTPSALGSLQYLIDIGGGSYVRINADGKIRFAWNSSTTSDTALSAATLHYVSAGYDGTNRWIRIDKGTRKEQVGAPRADLLNPLVRIGARSSGNFVDGLMEDWYYWVRTLTDDELDDLQDGNGPY